MIDNLSEYRARFWPRACFPPRCTEDEIGNYVLWQYISFRRAQWRTERRALRPPLRLRLAVRVRWCWLALRTVARMVRWMLVRDGSWPTRSALARRIRRKRADGNN